MRAEAEFDAYFSATLRSKLDTLESYRKKRLRYFYLYVGIVVTLGIILEVVHLRDEESSALGWLIVLVICNVLFYKAVLVIIMSDFVEQFKDEIVSAMVHFYDPSLKYDHEKGILLPAIVISNIFRPPFTVYASDDYVEGKIGETIIQFSEVYLSTYRVFGSTTFSGLFMIASFNKHFKGEYLIRSDESEKHFGESLSNMIKRISDGGSSLMKMDNPEFQQEFSVYGTDEQEARYLLTPAVMTKMLDFKKKIGNKVSYSFARSKLFVAISTESDLFEPPLLSPVADEKIYAWNTYIHSALSIVDEFNLNTRLWSKK
jgi:hypothetical protein